MPECRCPLFQRVFFIIGHTIHIFVRSARIPSETRHSTSKTWSRVRAHTCNFNVNWWPWQCCNKLISRIGKSTHLQWGNESTRNVDWCTFFLPEIYFALDQNAKLHTLGRMGARNGHGEKEREREREEITQWPSSSRDRRNSIGKRKTTSDENGFLSECFH